jgi:hypothetical protein
MPYGGSFALQSPMSRHPFRALWIVLLSSVAVSAQQPLSDQQRKNDALDAITIRGCVTESMGRYMLKQAQIVKPAPTPTPSAAADPAPVKASDDQIYGLIGDVVKPHVGHQVEIVGTMPSQAAQGNASEPQDAKQTAHPMTGTVNVTKVTMLASTCR